MPTHHAHHESAAFPPDPASRRAILLTCYQTGAAKGRNMGVAGYSYDIVAQLYLPLLKRWGPVIPVSDPRSGLDQAVATARSHGLEPIHVSFLPFQDVTLANDAPNVVVPAWEFPEVPDHPFDGNPQNDWPATANRCSLVIVGGPFTQKALLRAGTRTPIHVVPVPTPASYFSLTPWDPRGEHTLQCASYVFQNEGPEPVVVPIHQGRASGRRRRLHRLVSSCPRRIYQWIVRPLLSEHVARALWSGYHTAKQTWERSRSLPHRLAGKQSPLVLSGVVYTSILNTIDGRKNWQDLLTGFLIALGDREDTTLVVKLISSDRDSVDRVLTYYRLRGIPHRCKLVFVADYLTDDQMLQLAKASTYYVQTTRAEGNCLPLMNYLAAGRPGISPRHSAIADYFDPTVGLVIESHPEPTAWPHDRRLRIRTTWGRLVWPSLVAALCRSYQLAREDRAAYEAMGQRARRKMLAWASPEAVWSRLEPALDHALAIARGQNDAGSERLPPAA